MAKDDGKVEVTLARDAYVGPNGGLRKADSNIKLDRSEAQLLLIQGRARLTHPEKDAGPAPAPAVTLGRNNETDTGGAAPEEPKK